MPAHRKPTAKLKRSGAFRKNPKRESARKSEPRPNGPIGAPPASLSDPQVACWNEIIANSSPGVLTKADRVIVELGARTLAMVRGRGKLTAFQLQQMRAILSSLGMTPADRSRVSAPNAPALASPWDAIDNPSGANARAN